MSTAVQERLGAGPKARPVEVLPGESVRLPGAAVAAAARAGAADGARTAGDARRLGDDERVGALRRRGDRVPVNRLAGDLDLARAGADIEAGRRGGQRAADVRLRVGEARLDLRHSVACIGLGRSVLALLLLAEEARQRDRGEDADDQDDDEELDEREALVLVLEALKQDDPSCEISVIGLLCGGMTSRVVDSGVKVFAASPVLVP